MSKFCPHWGSLASRKWTLLLDLLTWDCCCRRCCFSKRPGFTRIVEATVYRCMLEGSTFVLTLFESCEPSRDLPRQVLKIRDTHQGCLPSRATRNCSSRCQSCGDEFHSQIFRDHDLSKSTRSVLVNSVMVLALQYQELQ